MNKLNELIKTQLTDDARHTVAQGLHVAADQFERDAAAQRKLRQPRLADQFRRQENETRMLAALFENACTVEVISEIETGEIE